MFVGLNLVLQWVLGSAKVDRGNTKMSPGRVSPGVLQRGVLFKELKRGYIAGPFNLFILTDLD